MAPFQTSAGIGRAGVALMAIAAGLTVVACGGSDHASSSATTTTASATSTTASTTAPSRPAGPTAEATNKTFVVTVPDGWEGWQTDDTTVLALRTSDHRSNMSVKLTPGAEILTAQEAADAGAEALTQDPTIKAVIDAPGTEETTVDGESARGYTYTLPAGVGGRTAESRGRQMFVKHAGKIYTVSFSSQTDAFGTANADYEKVIASWKWSG